MSVDTYNKLKSKDKEELFTELLELKSRRSELDKRIKVLEAGYKLDLEDLHHNLYYELGNGRKFSIKRSIRAPSYSKPLLDKYFETQDVEGDDFKGKPSIVFTLREDK